jgi:hypothetical protein
MVTLVVIMALLLLGMAAVINSSSAFDLSKVRPISNSVEINRETPDAVLADELCKGNIDHDMYVMFVAEKMDLKVS